MKFFLIICFLLTSFSSFANDITEFSLTSGGLEVVVNNRTAKFLSLNRLCTEIFLDGEMKNDSDSILSGSALLRDGHSEESGQDVSVTEHVVISGEGGLSIDYFIHRDYKNTQVKIGERSSMILHQLIREAVKYCSVREET